MKHTKELYLSQTLYNEGHQKCQGGSSEHSFREHRPRYIYENLCRKTLM